MTLAVKINSLLLGKGSVCNLDNITVAENESPLKKFSEYECGNMMTNLSFRNNEVVITINSSTNYEKSFVNGTLIQCLVPENPEICGNSNGKLNDKPGIIEVPPKDKPFNQSTVSHYGILGHEENRLKFEMLLMEVS
ncbi:hypothetical protein FGIG_12295 [Fasciola gigantica]|uniref:CUB domain-containing protein n=1 Tax=Fasciola gigantica TaxID=46835 RepID=A0A504YJM1_FASGI|nr:hypothetical protein FGIG_12295 [Fasciola gigantica]